VTQRLTKGMFGEEFGPVPATALFGLSCGQVRSRDFVHNGGWYNRDGEKLGWGDLTLADFQRIAEGLQGDELFIILSENDSFWSFVTSPGIVPTVKPTIQSPGVDYVAEKAMYIIAPMVLYVVDHGFRETDTVEVAGLTFRVLKGTDVKTFITRELTVA